jgi:hypothetical protein
MREYCSPSEVRTQINKTGTTGAGSDDALKIIIQAISDSIDRYCNRIEDGFQASIAETRVFPGSGLPYTRIDECISITSVSVKDSATDDDYTSWTSSDWIAFSGDPEWPNFTRLPYTQLMTDPNGDYSVFTSGLFSSTRGFRPSVGYKRNVPTVQVLARYGYSAKAPAVVKQVTIGLAARAFKQGQSSWADTLASVDFGQLLYMSQNSDLANMLINARLVRPPI